LLVEVCFSHFFIFLFSFVTKCVCCQCTHQWGCWGPVWFEDRWMARPTYWGWLWAWLVGTQGYPYLTTIKVRSQGRATLKEKGRPGRNDRAMVGVGDIDSSSAYSSSSSSSSVVEGDRRKNKKSSKNLSKLTPREKLTLVTGIDGLW
jgi:hypothetical protein